MEEQNSAWPGWGLKWCRVWGSSWETRSPGRWRGAGHQPSECAGEYRKRWVSLKAAHLFTAPAKAHPHPTRPSTLKPLFTPCRNIGFLPGMSKCEVDSAVIFTQLLLDARSQSSISQKTGVCEFKVHDELTDTIPGISGQIVMCSARPRGQHGAGRCAHWPTVRRKWADDGGQVGWHRSLTEWHTMAAGLIVITGFRQLQTDRRNELNTKDTYTSVHINSEKFSNFWYRVPTAAWGKLVGKVTKFVLIHGSSCFYYWIIYLLLETNCLQT